MSLSVSRFTRTLSAVATAAMVLTGISLVAVAPANAEPATVIVTGNDIRPNEASYPGWHEGYSNPDRAYFVADDGLHLGVGEHSQVLNGLDEPYPTNETELGSLITSAAVTTSAGLATLQVPLFFGPGLTQEFTTLWSADVVTGANSFSLDSQWVTTRSIGAVTAGTQDTLANLLTALQNEGSIRLLGFGVQANAATPGQEAVVSGVTWGGTDYVFQPYVAAAPTTHVTVNQRDVKPSETPETYESWHEGKSAPGYVVKADGLHLGVPTSSTVIKGSTVYDNLPDANDADRVTQAQLQDLIAKASVTVVSGTVTFQIPIHFSNSATLDNFTTLRSVSLDAGTHTASLNDTWATSRAWGPYGVQAEDTLGDLLDTLFGSYDHVWVAGFGVQADASNPALVSTVVWDGTEYTFFQPETQACTPTAGPTASNQSSEGWTFGQTRSQGHNVFVADGLHVYTESNTSLDKAAGYRAVDLKLADVGVPSIDQTVTDGANPLLLPSMQLGVDFDGDHVWDGYLVGEPWVYGDNWWASNSIVNHSPAFVGLPTEGGGGSTINGTLDQYLIAYPDANIVSIGYSLGSGALGDSTIHSITVGCTTYGFSGTTAEDPTSTVNVNDSQILPIEDVVGWGDGYGHSPRSYSTETDGAHIGNGHATQLINTLATPMTTTELESLITSASVKVSSGSVTYQVALTYGDSNTFTTLRSTSLTAADNNFSVTDTWVSTRALVANGNVTPLTTTNYSAPLADLVAFINAQGNVKVLGFGIQADSPAVAQDIVFNGTQYHFVPTVADATGQVSIRVTQPEIALTEPGNYLSWHQGYPGQTGATQTFSVGEAGLILEPGNDPVYNASQILKGLDTPVAGADLYALLTSHAGVTVGVGGDVTYQVPVNFTDGWSTLRSASLSTGSHTFSLTDPWISSKAIGSSISAGVSYPLGDILDAMNALGNAEAIGFGVQTEVSAVVSDIVWGNTDYVFSGPIEGTQPTISGTAKVGSTLTADAGTWTPEGVALHYQWKADGNDVGTDSSSYVLAADDYNSTITVWVTGSKNGYNDVTEISDGTGEVAAADLVAGTPTITGAAQVGLQLTATPGTWTPSGVAFAYQWQVDGVDVAGETSASYTPVLSDIGKTVTVLVTGSLYGYNTVTASATTAAVTGSAVVTVLPSITGTPVVDGTLTASPGEWAPSGVTFTYQWNVGGTPVDGATAQSYTPRAGDVGSTVTVTVTGALEGSIPVSVNSAATSAVVKADITAGTPTISGTAKVGNELTANAGTWSPSSGVAFSYQWKANGSAVGTDSASYALTGADAGKTITVTVTGTKAGYNTATGISLGTADIADGDLSAGTVTITGTAQVGETVTANPGTWGPGTVGLAYQWYVGDLSTPIPGATDADYVVAPETWSGVLIVVVTGTQAGYTTETGQAATAAVIAGDLTATKPTITGAPLVGGTLTAHAGTWGPDGVVLAYQWAVGGVDVSATGTTYTPDSADVGKTVTVTVTGTLSGAAYTPQSLVSDPTGAVAEQAFVTVTPTIAGTAQVGATLTATAPAWTPAATTTVYQWLADGVAITDANGLSYTVTVADLGKKLTFEVSGTADGYAEAVATSAETAAVVDGVLTTVTPTIAPTAPKVGDTLTATVGTWAPAAAALSYQWLADNAVITGATGVTYLLDAADLGKKISFAVTGTLAGYTTATATSVQTSAVANGEITTGRLAGASRYDTAVEISKQFTSASRVYIATGTGYADALSAGPAAAHFNAPLLLTTPDSLPAVVATELNRLQPSEIVIVGGTGVVSAAVETALNSLSFHPTVRRVSGGDRYATSRALAVDTWTAGSLGTAYLATGTNFPDALSAGPAAAHFDGPVVLIPGMASSIDAATQALLSTLGVDKIKIAGGTGVISSAIEAQARVIFGTSNVIRNGAGNRYATSVAINADEFGSAETVYLATGSGYADALAGSALAGANGAPLFVTQTVCIPAAVMDAIEALGSTNVVLLGGTGVLTTGVEQLTTCG